MWRPLAAEHESMLLLLVLTAALASDCPSSCTCMWKMGKESTECVNLNLSHVPDLINPNTQVLVLNDNPLVNLASNLFIEKDLRHIQRLHCVNCELVEVENEAFNSLTNLVELDLSSNRLHEIPTQSWQFTPALMRLNMSGNPLKRIRNHAFRPLSGLRRLLLSRCDLSVIEGDAFAGLDNLEELGLDHNNLNFLADGNKLFPRSLEHIQLGGNGFHCNCRLSSFALWLQSSRLPHLDEPRCARPPRLRGRPVRALAAGQELACLPRVSVEGEPALRVPTGKAGLLRCRVLGLPSALVSWWKANRLLANDSALAIPWERDFYAVRQQTLDQHQLISELHILRARAEDSTTFHCSASNNAGVASVAFEVIVAEDNADHTVVVVDKRVHQPQEEQRDLEESQNKQDKEQDEEDMIQVEYLLGLGAAVVLVLTAIIVMLLYLMLRWRQHRRGTQLFNTLSHETNSSNSLIENEPLPKEMELTTTVRCVQTTNPRMNNEDSNNASFDRVGMKRAPPPYLNPPAPRANVREQQRHLAAHPGFPAFCPCCGEPAWLHAAPLLQLVPAPHLAPPAFSLAPANPASVPNPYLCSPWTPEPAISTPLSSFAPAKTSIRVQQPREALSDPETQTEPQIRRTKRRTRRSSVGVPHYVTLTRNQSPREPDSRLDSRLVLNFEGRQQRPRSKRVPKRSRASSFSRKESTRANYKGQTNKLLGEYTGILNDEESIGSVKCEISENCSKNENFSCPSNEEQESHEKECGIIVDENGACLAPNLLTNSGNESLGNNEGYFGSNHDYLFKDLPLPPVNRCLANSPSSSSSLEQLPRLTQRTFPNGNSNRRVERSPQTRTKKRVAFTNVDVTHNEEKEVWVRRDDEPAPAPAPVPVSAPVSVPRGPLLLLWGESPDEGYHEDESKTNSEPL